jgi:Fe-S cluster assembly ATP-binding protein
MLEIKNLYVSSKVDGRNYRTRERIILKNINMRIDKGEIYALLGPNASGKSTLASTIMGIPDFKVIKGRIIFNRKDITKMKLEDRVKLGVALAFQNPPEVKGVKFSQLIQEIIKQTHQDYENVLKTLSRYFNASRVNHLLDREINVKFSGGEKKLSELIQLITLKPKFVILDEIDSGLDIKIMEKMAKIIKKVFTNTGVSVLLITHSGSILRFLNPNKTGVMLNGEIICESYDWKVIWKTITRCGYEKCKKCLRYESRG